MGFMKRLYLVLGAVTLFFIFTNPALSADLKDEFLGIEWGADLSNLKSFYVLYKKGDLVYYVNPDKYYQINQSVLPPVIYGCYKGQFFAAYIRLDQMESFEEINSYMNSKYGLSVVNARSGQEVYKWKYDKIKIKLKNGYGENGMKLAFYYTPLSDKLNEPEQEKVEKSLQFLPIEKNKKYPAIPLLIF
jgi:hypothetical protein